MQVRRATTSADFRRLHELFVEYEADLPEELRHGTVPPISELAATYCGTNAAFVADADDDAIGCVAVRELDAETAVLLRLYVRPQRRGLGAARRLTVAAIAHARRRRYRRIVLDTNKERLMPAYRLYRSLGFAECAPFAAVTYACPTFMELSLQGDSVSRRSDSNR